MSKKIKQMEMDALKNTFKDVRDLVVLTASGVNCQADNQLRMTLRKRNIRLQMVKNSLTKRVFGDLGIKLDGIWEGSTLIAWGADSVAELSKSIAELLRKNEKVKVKKAVAEGQEVAFDLALKMPTRAEAIGTILAMILGPGAQIAGQIAGPAGQIAGQLKTLSEKKPEETPAPPGSPLAT